MSVCAPARPLSHYSPYLRQARREGEALWRELLLLLPELEQWLPDLSLLPALPSLSPEEEKRRLFATLTHFFLRQAAQQPLLLIIEDLHWSDDSSLQWLHSLARHCSTQRCLVLATYRSDELRPALRHWLAQVDREHLAQERSLAPLTRSDTEAMLQAILDIKHPIQTETLDVFYGLTEGNPFFVEEILKSLLASGERFRPDGSWERKPLGRWHVPRSVQDAVRQRFQQVSSQAQQILTLAAVAGRRFDFALLQQVTGDHEQHLLTLIKELLEAQLVVEESAERFAFRHALTRQAIYTELLVREGRALHRTIAETLEQLHRTDVRLYLADLAAHFYEAEVWEKAWEYGQRAGEEAQHLYAPHIAIEHYTRALAAAGHIEQSPSPQLSRARGQAYETVGMFEEAQADYEQARSAARLRED